MNCTECGADTIKSRPLCRHCTSDPDYADYRTDWDIWEDELWERAAVRLLTHAKAPEEVLMGAERIDDFPCTNCGDAVELSNGKRWHRQAGLCDVECVRPSKEKKEGGAALAGGKPQIPEEEIDCDKYGNPIDGDRIIHCCFPDCGCDGSRLCMAENGASDRSFQQNVEGMYQRKDNKAIKARLDLAGSVAEEDGQTEPRKTEG